MKRGAEISPEVIVVSPSVSSRSAGEWKRWAGLIVLCVALLLEGMNIGSVNVQLAPIGRDLGLPPSTLQYVVSAYLITYAGFLLLGGRAADLLGRRRIFIAGVTLFGLASLLAGLAPNGPVLVAARALQGIGAAVSTPAALALITTMFAEGPERNKALGVYSAMGAAGFSLGLLLSGAFTDLLGWRWGFFVYVPLTAIVLVLTPLWVPPDHLGSRQHRNYDLAGAATVTLGLMALVYAVGESHAIPVQHSATLLVIAVVLLGAFLVIERRAAFPLMPFRIFRLGTVRAANMLAATFFAAVSGLMFVGALYLQGVLGYSPFTAGLAFVPMAIAIAIVSNLGGRLVTRLGLRPALLLGLILLASGIAFISRIDVGVGYVAVLLPGSITVGIAIGLIFPAVMISAVAGVPETDRGLASSLVTTSQQTGGAIGTAITAAVIAVFNERFAAATGALPTAPESLIAGFQPGLIAAATIAALGIVVAATSLRERRQDSEADSAGAKIAAPAVGPDTVARSSSDHRP